jgi:peptide/nickel transport system ATP-binding protein
VTSPALSVRDLRITYPGPPPVQALDGIDLDLEAGECLAVIGESGCGKSTLARAALGLLEDATVEGSVHLGELDLSGLDEDGWRAVRWQRLALVFQSTSALNPVLRVGDQIGEAMQVHLDLRGREAADRAATLLERVGLDADKAGRYPRELSGGQQRLVLVAMALACEPEVLMLDEPTAGLDPLTRENMLELLGELRAERRSLLVLSHDIDAVGTVADRVAVLYRGWTAERGPAARVIDDPRHPYTFGLLNARPTLSTIKDLRGIRGDPPDPTTLAVGCPFRERCTQAQERCGDGRPPELAPEGEDAARVVGCVRGGVVAVVRARELRKAYTVRTGALRRTRVQAVDGVSLEVRHGEVLGLVGPNGAGKSTLGQLLLLLVEPDGGSLELEGRDLLAADAEGRAAARRGAQMLFQNPYEALSPRLTVREAVREPLDVQELGTAAEREEAVRRTLAAVRLPPEGGFLGRHTHELSGGQLQRVSLARALVLEPRLLVADEPLEGLDPSEQAKMLHLLKDLQVERGMAMVLVSHNLAVVLRTADRVLVLDEGRTVEEATGSQLLAAPRHPVTRRLLAASGRPTAFDDTEAQNGAPPHRTRQEEKQCAVPESASASPR